MKRAVGWMKYPQVKQIEIADAAIEPATIETTVATNALPNIPIRGRFGPAALSLSPAVLIAHLLPRCDLLDRKALFEIGHLPLKPNRQSAAPQARAMRPLQLVRSGQ